MTEFVCGAIEGGSDADAVYLVWAAVGGGGCEGVGGQRERVSEPGQEWGWENEGKKSPNMFPNLGVFYFFDLALGK